QQAAQQHGVEVGGEVDRNARAVRPSDLVDHLVLRGVVGGAYLQGGDLAVEPVGDVGGGVHLASSCDGQRGAGDVGGLVRRKIEHGVGDVLRHADAAQR